MLSQAMLLAEGMSPSTEEKLQPAPSLTSRSPEEEVDSLSDPLEAFLEYRRKRAQEPLARRGEMSKIDPEPSPEKKWSPWPQSMTLGLNSEGYVRSYLEAYLKLKEKGPSRKEESPRREKLRTLNWQPVRSEEFQGAGHEEHVFWTRPLPLNQPEAP
ncbi:hypothetical protein LINPERHAP1_LOCUS12759, partial [Linum perenne]